MRTLKVEELGNDFEPARRKSLLRLKGRWLERAGFRANDRASIVILGTGLIQIQCMPKVTK